jgi:metallophosphoesterase superfamily enzyme
MNDLPLFPDLFATPHRFAWHPVTHTAILADLHIGAFPVSGDGGPVLDAWRHVLARRPRRINLAGDILDDPLAGPAEITALRQLLALLGRPSPDGRWGECQVIVTPGNHDPANLGQSLGAQSAAEVTAGRYVVSHGHALTTSQSQPWIVGHQHPAVILRDQVRAARMACYALCAPSARRPAWVLMPAFSSQAGGPVGTNLLSRRWILPVPQPPAAKIRVFGLIEPLGGQAQVLDFGPLSGLRD